jgi:hypothetical protein
MDDIPTGLKDLTPEVRIKRSELPPLFQEPGGVGHAVTWHRWTETVGRAGNSQFVFFKTSRKKA